MSDKAGDKNAELLSAFARFGPAWLRWLRSHGPDDTLTPARMHLLKELQRSGEPRIMRHLCSALDVTPRNVTALVDGLETDGLVRRAPHPTDRRATLVELTPLGRRMLGQAWARHLRSAATLFDDLTEREQTQLLRILDKLADGLRRRQSD